MNKSFLSLGSNMGNRLEMLKQAVRSLEEYPAVNVLKISSLYETDPVGYTEQNAFLNMVVCLETSLTALELLEVCQDIERKLDRKREIRWGPRTIDLDILLFNHDKFDTERLSIPHPRMHERAFVLIPLLELDSNQDFIEPQRDGIELWKTYNSIDSFFTGRIEQHLALQVVIVWCRIFSCLKFTGSFFYVGTREIVYNR